VEVEKKRTFNVNYMSSCLGVTPQKSHWICTNSTTQPEHGRRATGPLFTGDANEIATRCIIAINQIKQNQTGSSKVKDKLKKESRMNAREVNQRNSACF